MSHNIALVRSISGLRQQVSEWRNQGLRIGLVPTMGALHKGHLSLVKAIAPKVDKIIVSIFVNPSQFGIGEDLENYPRTEADDCAKLSATPANLVFAPTVAEMYPGGHATRIIVSGISEILEGAQRRGHFDGVATIVSKLLHQCQPDTAIFGEKDYQQLAIIKQFVRDLDIPVEIIGGALIREADGLAYSSRNAYLNSAERAIAGQFNVILNDLVAKAQCGGSIRKIEDNAIAALLSAGFTQVDYVSIVDPKTLLPLEALTATARVLAVARVGGVRLLDNMEITAP